MGVLLADVCWLFLVVEVTVTPFLVADGGATKKVVREEGEGEAELQLANNHY